jgi:hypothetical protein
VGEPGLLEGRAQLGGPEPATDGDEPIVNAHRAAEEGGKDEPTEQVGHRRAVEVAHHKGPSRERVEALEERDHVAGVEMVEEERGGHDVVAGLSEGEGPNVGDDPSHIRRSVPQVVELHVQAHREDGPLEMLEQVGREGPRPAADVEEGPAGREVGPDRGQEVAPTPEPAVHEAEVAEAAGDLLVAHRTRRTHRTCRTYPGVEELRLRGAPPQVGEAREAHRNSRRASSAAKPGPKAPSSPLVPASGR